MLRYDSESPQMSKEVFILFPTMGKSKQLWVALFYHYALQVRRVGKWRQND